MINNNGMEELSKAEYNLRCGSAPVNNVTTCRNIIITIITIITININILIYFF